MQFRLSERRPGLQRCPMMAGTRAYADQWLWAMSNAADLMHEAAPAQSWKLALQICSDPPRARVLAAAAAGWDATRVTR